MAVPWPPTGAGGAAALEGGPLQPSPIWDDLRLSIIGTEDEPPVDPSVLLLDAPRADNPALVPVRITSRRARPRSPLALVVDGNPCAGRGRIHIRQALMPLDFEVRVRVNTYSDLRAVATLADGRQVMAGRYVRPRAAARRRRAKSMDEVRATMGQMRFRQARMPASWHADDPAPEFSACSAIR